MATVVSEAQAVGAVDVARSSRALLIVDDACTCLEASLGACTLLGLARAEVLDSRLHDLLEPASREPFTHVWEAFRASGGHAGPFALAETANTTEVEITVTPAMLPGFHLIALTDPLSADVAPATVARRGPGGAPGQRVPTSRECQVLELLASGSTDAEAASLLALSPATVQTHVRNAKAKLGAKTRAQAVALAVHRGLIGGGV